MPFSSATEFTQACHGGRRVASHEANLCLAVPIRPSMELCSWHVLYQFVSIQCPRLLYFTARLANILLMPCIGSPISYLHLSQLKSMEIRWIRWQLSQWAVNSYRRNLRVTHSCLTDGRTSFWRLFASGSSFFHGRTSRFWGPFCYGWGKEEYSSWVRDTLYSFHNCLNTSIAFCLDIGLSRTLQTLVRIHDAFKSLGIFLGFAAFFFMEKSLRVLGGGEEDSHSHGHSHSHSSIETSAIETTGVSVSSQTQLKSRNKSSTDSSMESTPKGSSPVNASSKLSAYLNLFGDFVHNMYVGLDLPCLLAHIMLSFTVQMD